MDGRPVPAYVDEFDYVAAAVKPTGGVHEKPLWFRRGQIFSWDQDLLTLLSDAYESKDAPMLHGLWGRAQAWFPASDEVLDLAESEGKTTSA